MDYREFIENIEGITKNLIGDGDTVSKEQFHELFDKEFDRLSREYERAERELQEKEQGDMFKIKDKRKSNDFRYNISIDYQDYSTAYVLVNNDRVASLEVIKSSLSNAGICLKYEGKHTVYFANEAEAIAYFERGLVDMIEKAIVQWIP